jgi:hypothetical protein
MAVVTEAAAQTSGAPVNYQDPDRKPFYFVDADELALSRLSRVR